MGASDGVSCGACCGKETVKGRTSTRRFPSSRSMPRILGLPGNGARNTLFGGFWNPAIWSSKGWGPGSRKQTCRQAPALGRGSLAAWRVAQAGGAHRAVGRVHAHRAREVSRPQLCCAPLEHVLRPDSETVDRALAVGRGRLGRHSLQPWRILFKSKRERKELNTTVSSQWLVLRFTCAYAGKTGAGFFFFSDHEKEPSFCPLACSAN